MILADKCSLTALTDNHYSWLRLTWRPACCTPGYEPWSPGWGRSQGGSHLHAHGSRDTTASTCPAPVIIVIITGIITIILTSSSLSSSSPLSPPSSSLSSQSLHIIYSPSPSLLTSHYDLHHNHHSLQHHHLVHHHYHHYPNPHPPHLVQDPVVVHGYLLCVQLVVLA